MEASHNVQSGQWREEPSSWEESPAPMTQIYGREPSGRRYCANSKLDCAAATTRGAVRTGNAVNTASPIKARTVAVQLMNSLYFRCLPEEGISVIPGSGEGLHVFTRSTGRPQDSIRATLNKSQWLWIDKGQTNGDRRVCGSSEVPMEKQSQKHCAG